jgi:phosphatidylserine/phosphatidylglycerophosphate/cardiolipin synthase-like enzyme
MASADETKELILGYRDACGRLYCADGSQPVRVDRQWWAAQGIDPAALVTSGNEVTPLIDGEAAMKAMYEEFTAAQHYILLTGWDIGVDVPLLGPQNPESTLLHVVKHVIHKPGSMVRLRFILWERESWDFTREGLLAKVLTFMTKASPYEIYRNALRLEIESVPENSSPLMMEDGSLRPDYRCKTLVYDATRLVGSLHQKTAIVDGRTAFCGGIDLAAGRWATRKHEGAVWHDVHVRIRGPAVRRIQENFVRRWRAEQSDPLDVGVIAEVAKGPEQLRLLRWEKEKELDLKLHDVVGARPGSLPVQVIRSIHHDSDADREDHSYLESYARAIINARQYIYIENQYFNCEFLTQLIIERLKAMRSLHVIILLPTEVENSPLYKLLDGGQMARINQAAPDRVMILNRFTPGSDGDLYGLFIHAKVMIVDDIYASIGSANFTDRSLESRDEELGIAWMDKPGASVSRFRKDLWSEHLNLDPSDPALDKASGEELMRLWQSRLKRAEPSGTYLERVDFRKLK